MSSGSYGEYRPPRGEPVVQLHVGENPPKQYHINTHEYTTPNTYLGKESGANPTHGRIHVEHIFDIGIFKDTLLPNLALHSSLAAVAWGAGRYFNYVESKDVLWASAQVANAWWSAVGSRFFMDGVPLGTILRALSWPEKLLLTGVTAWGGQMTYRVVSRALRRGTDDPRYASYRKEEGWWNKALFSTFLPEAAFQAVIALPFTAPFRHQGGVMTGYHPIIQSLSVGIFATGFALEYLADRQLEQYKRQPSGTGVLSDGVWSIVRHPNYLGDALIHASFPLLLFSSDMLAPIELLGPLANWFFLRYVSGDRATEMSQDERYAKESPDKKAQFDQYKTQKNSFWPAVNEFKNEWTLTVLGIGAATALAEVALKEWLH